MRMGIFALVLGFQLSAHAVTADQSLAVTVKSLMAIAQNPNQAQRVQDLCKLIRDTVDLKTVSDNILDSFSAFENDPKGIVNFNALLTSILVTDFYKMIMDHAGEPFKVQPTPLSGRGKANIAYPVDIGNSRIEVTMSKSSLKILDVSAKGMSLVQIKSEQYVQEMQRFWAANQLPITSLVNELSKRNDIIHCN